MWVACCGTDLRVVGADDGVSPDKEEAADYRVPIAAAGAGVLILVLAGFIQVRRRRTPRSSYSEHILF